MPGTEETITVGATGTEEAISADDSENLYDGGPYALGRYAVDLKAEEESMNPQ